MKCFSYQPILILFLLVLPVLTCCEKKEGKKYLRIVNSIKANSNPVVRDCKNEIPIDGNYHEVSGYLETEYKLLNVVWDSVTNWTSACILERVWVTNRTVNGYFGDFEKLPDDIYYTLTLNYKIEYSALIEYAWLPLWKNITFDYSDNSILRSSLLP